MIPRLPFPPPQPSLSSVASHEEDQRRIDDREPVPPPESRREVAHTAEYRQEQPAEARAQLQRRQTHRPAPTARPCGCRVPRALHRLADGRNRLCRQGGHLRGTGADDRGATGSFATSDRQATGGARAHQQLRRTGSADARLVVGREGGDTPRDHGERSLEALAQGEGLFRKSPDGETTGGKTLRKRDRSRRAGTDLRLPSRFTSTKGQRTTIRDRQTRHCCSSGRAVAEKPGSRKPLGGCAAYPSERSVQRI